MKNSFDMAVPANARVIKEMENSAWHVVLHITGSSRHYVTVRDTVDGSLLLSKAWNSAKKAQAHYEECIRFATPGIMIASVDRIADALRIQFPNMSPLEVIRMAVQIALKKRKRTLV